MLSQNHEIDRLQKIIEHLEEEVCREREKEAMLRGKSNDQLEELEALKDNLRRTIAESNHRQMTIDQMESEKLKVLEDRAHMEETMKEMRVHFDTVRSELKNFEKRSRDEAKNASDLQNEVILCSSKTLLHTKLHQT